jgi:hypothetical protein
MEVLGEGPGVRVLTSFCRAIINVSKPVKAKEKKIKGLEVLETLGAVPKESM